MAEIEQPLSYTFRPGVPSIVNLPSDGNNAFFEASLKTGLSGSLSLSACYDKYGILWKWSTFETGNSAIPGTSFIGLCALTAIAEFNTETLSSLFSHPSSWETTECILTSSPAGNPIPANAPWPKKWTVEGPLSGSIFNKFPECSASVAIWTLSSQEGWVSPPTVIPLPVSEIFNYNLRLEKDGLLIYTAPREQDTNFLLNVKLTGTCILSGDGVTQSFYYPEIDEIFEFASVVPPNLKIYTPNRFVLTGVNVNFENITTKLERVNRLDIDFDDGKFVTLTGNDININYFQQTYNIIGFKTLKFTVYTNTAPNPILVEFPDIIQVVEQYEQVSPSEYRSNLEPLNLPWKEQPRVGSNDWVNENNINVCFKKLYENLDYLETRGRYYPGSFSDYFGWLGPTSAGRNQLSACDIWTWDDVDCFTSSLPYDVTWRDVLSAEERSNSGKFFECGTWLQQECGGPGVNPFCEGKYCVNWNWRDRNKETLQLGTPEITWTLTREGSAFQKRWFFEPCATSLLVVCDEGQWNVNIPQLDEFYDTISTTTIQPKCIYRGIASKNNNLFLAQRTEVRLVSSDYKASLYNVLNKIDDVLEFSNLQNICIDSTNKIFILDKTLSQVAGFLYTPEDPRGRLNLYVNWGGFGTATARTKFSNPNDLHIDQFDNIWVTDTGNSCIKQYSNSGSWLNTILDPELQINAPLSVCVDSQQNVHVLTNKEIRVYSYSGTFLFVYDYKQFSTSQPKKINSSFNREIVYVAFNDQVLKFFRNGVFAGYIIQNQLGVRNINSIYHDEFRNLLITTDDKVLKYPDLMKLERSKGNLPSTYWNLNDIYIHKEEYVQNWIYTKAFQRMWDNIELFRNTLWFRESGCKKYVGPLYNKDKMIIGQNELVTASTINRVLGYLWENFNTLLNFFDPSCNDRDIT
jgi:hypothetical protein